MSYIVVIDVERSGDDMLNHAIINIGMVLMEVDSIKEIQRLDLWLQIPNDRCWSTKTLEWRRNELSLKVQHILEEKMKTEAVTVLEGMKKFVQTYQEWNIITKGDYVPLSDRADIDGAWISLYLNIAGFPAFHSLIDGEFRPLGDISSFHQGCAFMTHRLVVDFKRSRGKFNSTVPALKYLNIPNLPTCLEENKHLAVEDASRIALIHCLILNAMEKRIYQTNLQNFNPDNYSDHPLFNKSFQAKKKENTVAELIEPPCINDGKLLYSQVVIKKREPPENNKEQKNHPYPPCRCLSFFHV